MPYPQNPSFPSALALDASSSPIAVGGPCTRPLRRVFGWLDPWVRPQATRRLILHLAHFHSRPLAFIGASLAEGSSLLF